MPIECAPNIANILASLGGVIGGGLIGYFSASRISRFNARREVGAKLRAAFAHEQSLMRLAALKHKTIEVESLLAGAFPKHAAAIEEYRPFVRPKSQAAYQQAWEEYYCASGSVGWFNYYMGEGCHELFISRVNAILRFTET